MSLPPFDPLRPRPAAHELDGLEPTQPVSDPSAGLASPFAPYQLAQAGGSADLNAPLELVSPEPVNRRLSTEVRGALRRAFARLGEQDMDFGAVTFTIPEDRELSRPQREFLLANPGRTIARTEMELTPSQAVNLGIDVEFSGTLMMRVDVPIELFPDERDATFRATRRLLEERATAWIVRGLPNLSGETLSGESWPAGSRLEVRLGAGVEIGDALGIRGSRDIIVRAERQRPDRIELTVGSERANGLFGSLSLSDASIGADADERRLVEATYTINGADPAHVAAIGQLLQWRSGVPRVDVSALDALPDGEVRHAFDTERSVGPNVRLPLSQVTFRASQDLRTRESGWIRHPRSVDGQVLGSDGLAERIAAIRAGDIDVIRRTPAGTELLTRQMSGIDWSTSLTAGYAEPILEQFIQVGGNLTLSHREGETQTIQQRLRFTETDDGELRVILGFEVFDEERVREGVRANLGVQLGPAVRDYFVDEFGLNVDADAALNDLFSDPDALMERVGLEAFNAFEGAVNGLLDSLALRAEYRSDEETFSGERLESIPLDPNDPIHAAFIQFALGDAPADAVLAQAAALRADGTDLFPVRRSDWRVSQTDEWTFQALALRLALSERSAETRQRYVFPGPNGEPVVLDGRQIGRVEEQIGLFEDVRADFRAYTAVRASPPQRVIDSGIIAGFEFDDSRLNAAEVQALRALPNLLDLEVFESGAERKQGPFGIGGFGGADGGATISINQRGITNAIAAEDMAARFLDAAMRLRGHNGHWSQHAAAGPAAFSADIGRLVNASTECCYSNALARAARAREVFESRYPGLDLDYMQAITRVSPHQLDKWAVPRARELLSESHPDLQLSTAALRADVGYAMLANIAGQYAAADDEEREELQRDFRSLAERLGRPNEDLEFLHAVEERSARVAEIFSSPSFEIVRRRIERGEAVQLDELELLLSEGLRSILEESSITGDNDFYTLALWVAIAQTAGLDNVQAMVSVEPREEGGLRLQAGDEIFYREDIDALLDRARALIE